MSGVPYPKSAQVGNSPGGNPVCDTTGLRRSECSCPKCTGHKNRKGGLAAQRKSGRQLAKGMNRAPGRLNNEETTDWPIRWEHKSGAVGKPVGTFYLNTLAQADAATAIGSRYPFVGVAYPNGFDGGLAVLKVEDLMRLLNEARRGTL